MPTSTERRLQLRLDAVTVGRRVWHSVPTVAQLVIGAGAAYAIAHFALGHETPLLAVTVTLTALGFARDARPRRLLETLIGMLIGIALADVFVLLLGRGVWQLVVILALTLLVARAASPNPAFAVAAAVQSSLVVLLPSSLGTPFLRTLDALVGAVIALLVTAIVPRDSRGEARRAGRALFSVLSESTGSIVDALGGADTGAGELALARLRRTQPMIDEWSTSLDTAISVSRIAPLLRRHLPELRTQTRTLHAGDLTARHLRVLARRVEFLVRDGRRRPELAALVGEVGTAIRLLGDELDDRELVGAARSLLADVARRLDPAAITGDDGLADAAVVLLVRPLVVDLLVASGSGVDEARALLPPV